MSESTTTGKRSRSALSDEEFARVRRQMLSASAFMTDTVTWRAFRFGQLLATGASEQQALKVAGDDRVLNRLNMRKPHPKLVPLNVVILGAGFACSLPRLLGAGCSRVNPAFQVGLSVGPP